MTDSTNLQWRRSTTGRGAARLLAATCARIGHLEQRHTETPALPAEPHFFSTASVVISDTAARPSPCCGQAGSVE